MRLIDRYLAAVAAQLPAAAREDVVAELRDDIMSRIEARQEALGRDLTSDEVESILREVGHPLSVAGRYGAGPQHLIGPELFPWWLFAVKVGLIVLIGIMALSVGVKLTGGQDFGQALGQGIAGLFGNAATLIGMATVAGYIIERQSEKPSFLTDWRVRDLGFFEVARMDAEGFNRALNSGAGAPQSVRAISGQTMSPVARALSAAVATAVLTAWWIGAIRFGGLPMDQWIVEIAGIDYTQALRETVTMIFWPVVIYGLIRMSFDLFRATNARAVRMTALGDIGLSAGRLTIYSWLLLVSPLSRALGVDGPWSVIERVRGVIETGINSGVWSASGVVMMILAFMILEPTFQILASAWRLISGRDRRIEAWEERRA
ncbi:MAG: hypothetical protein J0L52_11215 [Caulobacterales bacterium]|nr:hypothetical protein [Caulobacterales bacterium]